MAKGETFKVHYTEVDGVCGYTVWWSARVETRYMREAQRPDWLARIVNSAVIGGRMKRTAHPPPKLSVEFDIDANRDLVRFCSWSQPHVS